MQTMILSWYLDKVVQQTLSIRCRPCKYLSLVLMYLWAISDPSTQVPTYQVLANTEDLPTYCSPTGQGRPPSLTTQPQSRPRPRHRTFICTIVFLNTTTTVLCYCRSWQVCRADTKLLRAAPRPTPPFPRGISRS